MLRTGYFAGGAAKVIPSWEYLGNGRRSTAATGITFTVAPDPNRVIVALMHTRASTTGNITFNGLAADGNVQRQDAGFSTVQIAWKHLPDGGTVKITSDGSTEPWVGAYSIITARREPQFTTSCPRNGTLTTGFTGAEVNALSLIASAANNGGNNITHSNAVDIYEVDMNGTTGGPSIGVESRADHARANGAANVVTSAGGSNYGCSVLATWYED